MPKVNAVSSPKKMNKQQRVQMAPTKQKLNFEGSFALAMTGITIPMPS